MQDLHKIQQGNMSKIDHQELVKLLGVTFDTNFSWDTHVDAILTKAT